MTTQTASDIADAFREHRANFGSMVQFGSVEICALVTESALGRELTSGGFSDTGDIDCKLLISDLRRLPVVGEVVTHDSRILRVATVATQQNALIAEVSLRPARR